MVREGLTMTLNRSLEPKRLQKYSTVHHSIVYHSEAWYGIVKYNMVWYGIA